jgi:hypothetical protein
MARDISGDLGVDDNIKVNLAVVGCVSVTGIQLVHWRDAVSTAVNFGLPGSECLVQRSIYWNSKECGPWSYL